MVFVASAIVLAADTGGNQRGGREQRVFMGGRDLVEGGGRRRGRRGRRGLGLGKGVVLREAVDTGSNEEDLAGMLEQVLGGAVDNICVEAHRQDRKSVV